MAGDKPFVPVGFYSAMCGHDTTLQNGKERVVPNFEEMVADLVQQAKQGINVVMQYQASGVANSTRLSGKYPGGCLCAVPGSLQQDCDNQTSILLDRMHEVGLKVMVDLAMPFRTIVCGTLPASSKPCPALTASGNSLTRGLDATADAWAVVQKAVDRYKGHPALLGWYVCDGE